MLTVIAVVDVIDLTLIAAPAPNEACCYSRCTHFLGTSTDVTAMKSLLGVPVPPFSEAVKRVLQRNCRHLLLCLFRPGDFLVNKAIKTTYISPMTTKRIH